MRVAFAGTPAFAASALSAILDAGFFVPVVLTQPDRPAGRGLNPQPSAVKALARSRGLPVLQPATLRTEEARAPVLAVPTDVLVVAAYGLILSPEVLGWPRHGGINIHASLLPRWRGAAPIQRALLAGDAVSGVSIMQMDAGLDTGAVIERVECPIGARETAGSLHDRLAAAGAAAIVGVLGRLERDGRLGSVPQAAEGATYAAKIGHAETVIDWSRPAEEIDRQVRAFNPVPGAATTWHGDPLKVWDAEPVAASSSPGTGLIVAAGPDGIDVGCGRGILRVREIQKAGGRRLPVAAFLSGHGLAAGDRLGGDG